MKVMTKIGTPLVAIKNPLLNILRQMEHKITPAVMPKIGTITFSYGFTVTELLKYLNYYLHEKYV